jgi:acetyl esterase/lipase
MSMHFDQRLYTPVDAADRESCRPDFAAVLYPGHLSIDPNYLALNPDIHVTSQTPPMFLLQVEDDPVDDVQNSLVYYAALNKAGVPMKMHLYVQGGHRLAEANEVSRDGMASVSGDLARDDRDGFEVGALGEQTREWALLREAFAKQCRRHNNSW